MTKIKDVTNKVDFGNNDDEVLPMTQCVCGHKFAPWTFIISIYEDDPYECPKCSAKLYFTNSIRVYQIEDSDQ